MKLPCFTIDSSTFVYALCTTQRGLAWRGFQVTRKTTHSVFIETPIGEVQLPRRELEQRGRVDRAGELYWLLADRPATTDRRIA